MLDFLTTDIIFFTKSLHWLLLELSFYVKFVDHLCFFCLEFVMLSHLFIASLSSPAGKGLASWLSFVMSNCEVVTFLLVSWVRCGA